MSKEGADTMQTNRDVPGLADPRVGEALSADVLERRSALPLKPDPVTLTGARVRLAPIDPDRDVEALHAVSNGRPARLGDRAVDAYDPDLLIWRYMAAGPFATAEDLGAWLRALAAAPNGLTFTIFDLATDRPIGSASYMANMPEHLKIELGSIWYSPLAQRTGANAEATLLMLAHAFDLGYRRAEWKCDALNARSRHVAERMGFRFEGIQESHYIVKGRNRDTAWFRILAHEWPATKAHLERLLAAE